MLLEPHRPPQWEQAARGLSQAGLGLRSVVKDAPAAYLASLGVVRRKQKALTTLSDTASWNRHLSESSITARALLRSEAEQGARAWLAAVPGGKTRMEGAAFVAELRRRLGVADAPADTWCPKCDGIMDRFSLHAGTCAAGGERTQRHNALRDLLASWADRAGLQPEVEKPGVLLPQRPDEARLAQRRPADIFLPSLSGSPAAIDLAVTAPQRQESLAQASQQAAAAASQYAAVKSAHQNTAQPRACVSCLSLLSPRELGTQLLPKLSSSSLVLSRRASARMQGLCMPTSSRSCLCCSAATTLEQPCAAEQKPRPRPGRREPYQLALVSPCHSLVSPSPPPAALPRRWVRPLSPGLAIPLPPAFFLQLALACSAVKFSCVVWSF